MHRARRIALITASVPLLTKRIRSMKRMRSMTKEASAFSSSVGAPNVLPFVAVRVISFHHRWMRVTEDQGPSCGTGR